MSGSTSESLSMFLKAMSRISYILTPRLLLQIYLNYSTIYGIFLSQKYTSIIVMNSSHESETIMNSSYIDLLQEHIFFEIYRSCFHIVFIDFML